MNSKQGISRRAAAPSTKSVRPSEGIFYLIRLPRGWRVQPVCAGDFPGEDFGHADFWVRLLADLLAKEWQPKVCEKFRTVATLRAGLLPLVYAFPRGRVVRQGRKFAVYHGDNRASFMRCTRSAIEDCFGIRGRAEWVFDEREQRIAHDRDRMREVLGLRETLPAVTVDWG